MKTVEDLMQMVKAGDAIAFEKLVEILQPIMFRHLLGKGANHHDADDAVSEAMFNIWRNRSKYDPRKPPVTRWALSIASNALTSLYRTRNRKRRGGGMKHLEMEEETLPEEIDVHRIEEIYTTLVSEIETLPSPIYVVMNELLAGKSYGEIAATVNCCKTTVYQRVKQAREILSESQELLELSCTADVDAA